MNREVELILSGLHDAEGTSDKDTVETAQTAQYFKRNDSHYLLYEENIREVIPFPMSGTAQDLMCGAPNEVTEQQLREVHIKVRQ